MTDVAIYYLPEAATAPPARPRSTRAISDVAMRHTSDGGEIDIVNGEPVMSDGLFNAVYLSLFGGNEEDSGLSGTALKQWWGNLSESDPARTYRSETQFLLATLPPTAGNLRRVESGAQNDLAWLVSAGLARAVIVGATMPARNRVDLAVQVEFDSGEVHKFNVPRSWGERAA